jgi:GNAT superfamily N-acetyltransferase
MSEPHESQPAPPPVGYSISTSNEDIDFPYVHRFLSQESYWARGISVRRLRRAIANSLCFRLFCRRRQVGFARVVTDYGVFAYVCDVFVDPNHRGKGLGKLLMSSIMTHERLDEMRRWVLCTKDAHGLYARAGFSALANPQRPA